MLHTCKDGMSHTGEWKRLADKVNRYYGYNIKRCTSAEEKGIKVEKKENNYKYVFKCTGCGQTIGRMRQSRFTQYYYAYRCGRCMGKFEQIL